ncbi:class I SAM-dependent methyltransferase [Pleurocapsales cyanobacterium LEGE 06147]|nr:class I SAM-dependent methyltransferase [Pleurocapsales cyanobacterium LEGE 06147]
MTNLSYIGSELKLFREAYNWKAYWSSLIRAYIGAEVLEVGAGIGGTTEVLCKGDRKRWVCLEPDPMLASILNCSIIKDYLSECCEVKIGTLLDLDREDMFNSIIYIDVLEHIKNDRAETRLAASHLRDGGFLIVLVPSHQWLFTPFDRAIGHYRRYNKKMLSAIIPETVECVSLRYLDSIGLLASLGNRLILKSKMPSRKQILFWDRVMVPLSRKLDPLFQYSLGKSLLGIWRKQV